MKKISLSVLLAIALLSACSQPAPVIPAQAAIESVGMQASQSLNQQAIQQLQQWSEAGNPVAQRELAIALKLRQQLPAALNWMEKAAQAGDQEAQFLLAELYYKGQPGFPADAAKAWHWYQAAAGKNNKASFMLARMAKYGEGRPASLSESVHWLQQSSAQGNAQAMFLLSNAYQSGEGIGADQKLAQHWLEAAAEGDYPPAIQTLALQLDGRDHQQHDAQRARLLIKEATDERLLRWNQYQ